MELEHVIRYHVLKARDFHKEAMKMFKRGGNPMVFEALTNGRNMHMAMAKCVRDSMFESDPGW